jgi:predicted N-acyltransferase
LGILFLSIQRREGRMSKLLKREFVMSRKLITTTVTVMVDDYSAGDEEAIRGFVSEAVDAEFCSAEPELAKGSARYLETETSAVFDAE